MVLVVGGILVFYSGPNQALGLKMGSSRKIIRNLYKHKGFLSLQTMLSAVRLMVEGCRVKNEGCGLRVKNK